MIKIVDKDEGDFVEVDVKYQKKNCMNFNGDLPLLPDRIKIEKAEKLVAI